MAFSLALQSAPEWRGTWTPPLAWGGSTARAVISGRYSGKENGRYTLTVIVGGAIGGATGIRVDWTFAPAVGGTGASGRLDLGTDSGYFAGKKILFHGDLLVHFLTGTLVTGAGGLSTFDVKAARRLPRSFHRIAGTANPADVSLITAARSPTDAFFVTDAGDVSALAKRRGHAPTLQVIYQDNAAKRQMEHMEGQRQAVTLGEHYDEDTVFLLRGGGTEPMIGSVLGNFPTGQPATGIRPGSSGTYWDHRSGQFRRAAINQARTSPGVQLESGEGSGPQDRQYVPLRYKHVGRALRVSSLAVTNILPNSHPTPPLPESPTVFPGWNTQAGTPTITFVYGHLGILSPDDPNWPDRFTEGFYRIQLDNTEAVQTDQANIAPASARKFMVSLWVRGRGDFIFEVYGGIAPAVPNTLRGTLTKPTNYGTETDWQRIEGEITSGATDDRLAIRIRSTLADGIVFVSAAQIVRTDWKQASIYEPTTASLFTRSAETYTISDPLPEQAGTLQFWFQNTGDDRDGVFPIVDVITPTTPAGRFAVRVDCGGTDQAQFHTSVSGTPLLGNFPVNMKIHEWRHIAVTWEVGGINGVQLTRNLYIDGAPIANDETSNWDPWGLISLFPVIGSTQTANDWCIQELRIDRRRLTDAEILDSYQRYTQDKWIHLQRLYAGREFRIGAIADRWRHPQLPHVLIADVSLIESGVHEHSLVGDP